MNNMEERLEYLNQIKKLEAEISNLKEENLKLHKEQYKQAIKQQEDAEKIISEYNIQQINDFKND